MFVKLLSWRSIISFDSNFTFIEKKLLQAGLFYSVGQIDKALSILESDDQDDESSITSVGDLHDDAGANQDGANEVNEHVSSAASAASTSIGSEHEENPESSLARHIVEVERHVNKALVSMMVFVIYFDTRGLYFCRPPLRLYSTVS